VKRAAETIMSIASAVETSYLARGFE